MKLWIRSYLSLTHLAVILLITLLYGCSPLYPEGQIEDSPKSSGLQDNIEEAVQFFKVGVAPDAPPLIFKKKDKISGLEADFSHALAKLLGKKVQFVELPFEKLVDALENGEIDIVMSGMSITGQRSYRIAFTKPYLRSGQILLVRGEDRNIFSTGIYSVMNKAYVIGVIEGTTGDLFVTQTINGAKIKRFKDSFTGVQALSEKNIDVLVYDAPMVCYHAAYSENQQLVPILDLATEEYLAWGVRRDDRQLLETANAFIESSESSGRLRQLIKKWIPYL